MDKELKEYLDFTNLTLCKILAAIEALDQTIKGVIEGENSVAVVQQGPVTVETDCDRPIATYEYRS